LPGGGEGKWRESVFWRMGEENLPPGGRCWEGRFVKLSDLDAVGRGRSLTMRWKNPSLTGKIALTQKTREERAILVGDTAGLSTEILGRITSAAGQGKEVTRMSQHAHEGNSV